MGAFFSPQGVKQKYSILVVKDMDSGIFLRWWIASALSPLGSLPQNEEDKKKPHKLYHPRN